jgi:hypothetical protein
MQWKNKLVRFSIMLLMATIEEAKAKISWKVCVVGKTLNGEYKASDIVISPCHVK